MFSERIQGSVEMIEFTVFNYEFMYIFSSKYNVGKVYGVFASG